MTSKFEYKKACQFCGNTFVAYTSTTKYCSNICSNRGSKAEKRQERLQIESKAIKERNRQNLLMQENLSLTDAAALLGISRPTLYNLLQTKNINNSLDKIETQDTRRQFLTIKEVQALYNTPCREPVLKAASLFSCLTGLRFSDILALKWENFETYPDGGHCIRLRTEKTDAEALNPISQEVYDLCGTKSTGLVFKGFRKTMLQNILPVWLKATGITKHITFHLARHTFATLLVSSGSEIYTVSKMLTHKNVSTTQIYADLIDEKKRQAAEIIKIKNNNVEKEKIR